MFAPSESPVALAVSDALAIVAFVSVGLVSHRHGVSATGYARDALPILGAWLAASLVFKTYSIGGMRRLLETWAVAVPLGVLVRGIVLGRTLGADQFEFLGVALVFSLIFVLALRATVTTVLARVGA